MCKTPGQAVILGFKVVTLNTLHYFSECFRRVKRTLLREARFTLKPPYPGDHSIRTHNFCALPPADLDLSKLKASGLASSSDRQRSQPAHHVTEPSALGLIVETTFNANYSKRFRASVSQPYSSVTTLTKLYRGEPLHNWQGTLAGGLGWWRE